MLTALVSLELGHSVEVPHSAFKPYHAQLHSQAGKGTEVSCRATVCVFGFDLGGLKGSLTPAEVSLPH